MITCNSVIFIELVMATLMSILSVYAVSLAFFYGRMARLDYLALIYKILNNTNH